LELVNAGLSSAVGRFFEAGFDGFQPTVGDFLEGQGAGVFGLAEAGDLLAKYGETARSKFTI
jgi:hypothetical protein